MDMATSPLNPASPQAMAIAELFHTVLIITGAIFVLVTGLVLYVMLRYRRRANQDEPRQVFGSAPLELTWTAASLAIVAVLFGFTLSTMRVSNPSAPPNQKPDIEIVGR